ncbi:hypothetical protein GCM10010230_33700 [Streptomyces narbonensis]|nr:hypothetical protein GCM10010230_33700 [Streptomyces narbonensis]
MPPILRSPTPVSGADRDETTIPSPEPRCTNGGGRTGRARSRGPRCLGRRPGPEGGQGRGASAGPGPEGPVPRARAPVPRQARPCFGGAKLPLRGPGRSPGEKNPLGPGSRAEGLSAAAARTGGAKLPP